MVHHCVEHAYLSWMKLPGSGTLFRSSRLVAIVLSINSAKILRQGLFSSYKIRLLGQVSLLDFTCSGAIEAKASSFVRSRVAALVRPLPVRPGVSSP